MKLLLHTCCGPCTIVPSRRLREEGMELYGVYENPNVHPFTEWDRRRDALETLARDSGLRLLPHGEYDVARWMRGVAFREGERCRICYHLRLLQTARLARRGRFDAFSSTLLYSKFQKHDLVRELGESAAAEAGVPFLYRDWRDGWSEGVQASKTMGLYRQAYCGCILSEQERFARKGRGEDA
jgi:predicted adenine nucleotide alpha hydrolase (AANH) superfamily ATPase